MLTAIIVITMTSQRSKGKQNSKLSALSVISNHSGFFKLFFIINIECIICFGVEVCDSSVLNNTKCTSQHISSPSVHYLTTHPPPPSPHSVLVCELEKMISGILLILTFTFHSLQPIFKLFLILYIIEIFTK